MNRKERRAAAAGTSGNINLSQIFSEAIYFHRAGRLVDAENLYKKIITVQPDHPETLNFLGVCQGQQGKNHEAERNLRKVIAIKPDRFEAYSDLAVILKNQSRFDEALELFEKSININPNFASGLYNLANEYMRRGDANRAIEFFEKSVVLEPNFDVFNNLCLLLKDKEPDKAEIYARKALEMNPSSPEVLSNLGIILGIKGNYIESEKLFRAAIGVRPNFADAYNNLGFILQKQGKFLEAKENYEKAIFIKPFFQDALLNLGAVLCEIKDFSGSESILKQTLNMGESNPEALNNIGVVMMQQLKYEEAEKIFQKVIEIKPEFADGHNNYGFLLEKMNRLEDAICYFKKATELRPNYPEAFNNISFVLQGMGRVRESVENSKKTLQLKPDYYQARSNMLFSMHYDESFSNQTMFEEAKLWGELHTPESLKKFSHENRKKNEKIKIGYVSGDLKNHPVGYFLLNVLKEHNKNEFEIYAYSNHNMKDELTEKIAAEVNVWSDVYQYNDDELAKIINDDKIDVLIDLSGHTVRNRLLAFARKPAPIQMTWLGYFNTTGVKAIDYIIADKYVIPESDENFYIEKVLRMPNSYLCFTAPELDIAVEEPPFQKNGYITFGCFNNLTKVSNGLVKLWCQILKDSEDSKLFLKTFNFDDKFSKNRIIKEFELNGIGEERLIIEGGASREDLIKCYNRVDIALDTFPYNGGTTTVEALWMGVPVLSLAGNNFVGRVGSSILNNLSLSELICASKEDYVEKILSLSRDKNKILNLRKELRKNLTDSILCDAEVFTNDFENLIKSVLN